jgi:hypothetical protein
MDALTLSPRPSTFLNGTGLIVAMATTPELVSFGLRGIPTVFAQPFLVHP